MAFLLTFLSSNPFSHEPKRALAALSLVEQDEDDLRLQDTKFHCHIMLKLQPTLDSNLVCFNLNSSSVRPVYMRRGFCPLFFRFSVWVVTTQRRGKGH